MNLPRIGFYNFAIYAATLIAFIATILLAVPFSPITTNLDSEPWRYALNVAVAEHMVFGRDIVFTGGPLSSVYTRVYHPATDVLMMTGSLILAFALWVGFAAITPVQRRPWLLLVPLVISQLPFEGAMVLALPLLLVLNAEACANVSGFKRLIPIYVVAIACMLLPLIKGTMAMAVGVSIAIAFLALIRRRPLAATFLILVSLATLIISWLCTGQQISALPIFFLSQLPVMSGYTVAMALTGSKWEVAAYPIFSLGIIWAIGGSHWPQRWRITLATSLLLFIAFKAGFVRHDGHAMIAACALALAGIITFVEKPTLTRKGAVALLSGLFGAVVVSISYHSYHWIEMRASVLALLEDAGHGLYERITDPERLPAKFAQENARLHDAVPLPAYSGDADIYPYAVATLVASGTRWNPRPTVLSYTAYTPSLAQADVEHLRIKPPSRIYFSITPIDDRYPSLEDGLSWPTLLSDYQPDGRVGIYATLNYRRGATTVAFGPANSVTQRTGQPVDLDAKRPIWAKVDLQPTLLGRVVSIFYKLPTLYMSLRYMDGSVRRYRFIPGMGSAGFLLSPTITNSTEFVSLLSHHRETLLRAQSLKGMTLSGESGTRWLWKSTFTMTTQELQIAPSDAADSLLLNRLTTGPNADSLPLGGDCAIDTINGSTSIDDLSTAGGVLWVSGWGLASAAQGELADSIELALMQGDRTYFAQTHSVQRADLAQGFHHPEFVTAGYEALIDTKGLNGKFDLQVVLKRGDSRIVCGRRLPVTIQA